MLAYTEELHAAVLRAMRRRLKKRRAPGARTAIKVGDQIVGYLVDLTDHIQGARCAQFEVVLKD